MIDELRKLPQLEEAPSRFDASVTAFRLDGCEIVHLHGDEIEVRLTRPLIGRLDDERAWQRARYSDWVGTRDRALALDLVRRAIAANRR